MSKVGTNWEMNQRIPTKDPAAVAQVVQATYLEIFPDGDQTFVSRAFQWAGDCFSGRYGDFQPVDARYHDFEHTLQGTLCMIRILRGRSVAGAQPALPQRMAELGIAAILLHDIGYLKKQGDNSGTGAKYTAVHVGRSADFAGQLLVEKSFTPKEIASVQNMICCTGVDALLKVIPFQNELEKTTGLCLGTADLLGQMAADDYVEKLPILYAEFAEAAKATPHKAAMINMFSSAKDLLKKTPAFWENYVKLKLERDFDGQYRYLNDPFPDGANEYMEQIETNIQRLRKLISSEADTANFIKKHSVPA